MKARRVRTLLLAAALLLLGLVVALGGGAGYSDGTAGDSGQMEPQFWGTCGSAGGYCKVRPSYCGGCHGTYDDMWRQEGSKPTPQERVGQVTFKLNGDAKAGLAGGLWQYDPGQVFQVDIALPDARPAGTYASGAFDLNATFGTFDKWSQDDATVRITGGLYYHQGTKNPNVPLNGNLRHGEGFDNESKYAGEATNTGQGSDVRSWRVRWTAPPAQEPHGVFLVMTAMLPNGDGLDSCVYVACNQTRGYAAQTDWDWFGFMIPRRALCERGFFPDYHACEKAMEQAYLPPAPPVATCGPENPQCLASATSSEAKGSPGVAGVAVGAALGLAGWFHRGSRRGNR